MKLTLVAGARPNFIKVAPVIHAIEKLAKDEIKYRLVHTGQHYDNNTSDRFFKELNIPEPDIKLGCNSRKIDNIKPYSTNYRKKLKDITYKKEHPY